MPKQKPLQILSLTFYRLHEAIVTKADKELKEKGGLDRTSDQSFYGHGEGEDTQRSINYVITQELQKRRFNYEGFYTDKDGNPKFNIDYLRKLKAIYNNKLQHDNFGTSQIEVKEAYWKAFLFFVEKSAKEVEHLALKSKNDLSIAHTSIRKQKNQEDKKTAFFFENSKIPEGYESQIKTSLEDTEWYLYTYNFDHNRIVKALLTFETLGDGNNYINLINAGGGYNYVGAANFRLAYHRIIALDLVSRLVPAKHFHLKFYINFGRTDQSLMLGQEIGFGHSYKIIASRAILIKMDKEEDSPLGIGFYEPNHEGLHPAVERYLNPKNIELSVVPWHTFFSLDDLWDWLDAPSLEHPKHYSPL